MPFNSGPAPRRDPASAQIGFKLDRMLAKFVGVHVLEGEGVVPRARSDLAAIA